MVKIKSLVSGLETTRGGVRVHGLRRSGSLDGAISRDEGPFTLELHPEKKRFDILCLRERFLFEKKKSD